MISMHPVQAMEVFGDENDDAVKSEEQEATSVSFPE